LAVNGIDTHFVPVILPRAYVAPFIGILGTSTSGKNQPYNELLKHSDIFHEP